MNAYLEIRLLPDPEFPAAMLMSAVFAKLHRGLVEHGGMNIGISFPDIRDKNAKTLGQRLRLHGTEPELMRLMQLDWTTGIRDLAEIAQIASVPPNARHRVVRRVQAKSSPERLRRRLVARKPMDADAARLAIPDSAIQLLGLPYVVLTSSTNRQRFKLFVEHMPLRDDAASGLFSAYGLSSTATVPWF